MISECRRQLSACAALYRSNDLDHFTQFIHYCKNDECSDKSEKHRQYYNHSYICMMCDVANKSIIKISPCNHKICQACYTFKTKCDICKSTTRKITILGDHPDKKSIEEKWYNQNYADILYRQGDEYDEHIVKLMPYNPLVEQKQLIKQIEPVLNDISDDLIRQADDYIEDQLMSNASEERAQNNSPVNSQSQNRQIQNLQQPSNQPRKCVMCFTNPGTESLICQHKCCDVCSSNIQTSGDILICGVCHEPALIN